jgi:hypothetical protein
VTNDDYVKGILATPMWREDRGDALQGMTACGLVVRNRVKAGWHGGDWIAVMSAHNQYSSMSVVGDTQTVVWGDTSDPLFQRVLWKVDDIYSGKELDITEGALYYANLNTMNSPWFKENIVGNPEAHPIVASVGKHKFFK